MCIRDSAYVVLEAIDKKIKNRKLYICLFAITTLGALTHYYCIVFDVFISLIFGIYLLSQKDYRQTITFSAVQGLSLIHICSMAYLLPQVGQKRLWQRKGTNFNLPQ